MRRHTRTNRRYWNRESDEYQALHGDRLAEAALAWGVWRIPEAEVGALGDVEGRDVLEYGCGAAQWSVALAGLGARPVGLDLSEKQLAHARDNVDRSGVRVPLVQADGERLPFRDASFDVVLCDHGVMGFADPRRTIPEVERVLRPGGRFAFCMATPWLFTCWDDDANEVGFRLHHSYFDLDHQESGGFIEFQVPYGEWIRLFRAAGLVVEDLVELRPPEGAQTTYGDYVKADWARLWPGEHVWRLAKPAS